MSSAFSSHLKTLPPAPLPLETFPSLISRLCVRRTQKWWADKTLNQLIPSCQNWLVASAIPLPVPPMPEAQHSSDGTSHVAPLKAIAATAALSSLATTSPSPSPACAARGSLYALDRRFVLRSDARVAGVKGAGVAVRCVVRCVEMEDGERGVDEGGDWAWVGAGVEVGVGEGEGKTLTTTRAVVVSWMPNVRNASPIWFLVRDGFEKDRGNDEKGPVGVDMGKWTSSADRLST